MTYYVQQDVCMFVLSILATGQLRDSKIWYMIPHVSI